MELLKKGDRVAIVSPSSCIEKDALDKGIMWLKSINLDVVVMPHVYDAELYMAGTDLNRADDVNKAFADKSIKALFCSRGGAGATKILDYLDYDLIKNNPKPVFGLSDSTALQNALYQKSEIVSYTGFLPTYDFKKDTLDTLTFTSLTDVFSGKMQILNKGKTLNRGTAKGVLIGGTLSVLNYLCGTKYFPDLTDKILLLEDIGEKTYKIDLMLNQLKQQNGFDKLKGIIFGEFTNCVNLGGTDGSIETIISRFSDDINIPVIYDFAYGHVDSRYVLPIGAEVFLDADNVVVRTPSLADIQSF